MSSLKSITIDPKEVAYYEGLAQTWWDEQGPFWPLHVLNELRIQWITAQLNKAGRDLKGSKVLDIGCGGGLLSEALAKQGANVTAVDVVDKNISIAKAHAHDSQLDINYQHVSVEQLVDENQRYDIVFNMEVVEHVACVNTFMGCSNQLVKHDGIQFIATINRNWLAYFIAIFGAEYVTKLLPKGTHHYHKLVKPSELTSILTEDHFAVVAKTGVSVNPVKRSMKLIPKTWVNYMLMAHKQ